MDIFAETDKLFNLITFPKTIGSYGFKRLDYSKYGIKQSILVGEGASDSSVLIIPEHSNEINIGLMAETTGLEWASVKDKIIRFFIYNGLIVFDLYYVGETRVFGHQPDTSPCHILFFSETSVEHERGVWRAGTTDRCLFQVGVTYYNADYKFEYFIEKFKDCYSEDLKIDRRIVKLHNMGHF